MATQAEVSAKLTERLIHKQLAGLTWSDVVSAFGSATQQEKDALVNGIKRRSDAKMGNAIARVMRRRILVSAKAEADAMVANNTLSLAEFERAFL